MKLLKTILFTFLVATSFATYSQTTELTELSDTSELIDVEELDSTNVSFWIVGLGFNAVDDSGNVFKGVFDTDEGWNAVPYPSRISVGRYFKSGFGLEGIFTYNKYKKGKIVDNFPLEDDVDYFAFDTRLSYDLNKIVGETGWFDPYAGVGLGFTNANSNSRGTYNAIVGFRIWFSDRFGMDVNSTGKWGMNQNFRNHKQHAIGVVYRFDVDKELTKKDQEKLDLQEELLAEQARVEDSIANVNKANAEAALLAEQLAKQQAEAAEKERLAKLEQEKLEAKNKIQAEIDELENIYFAFDSSRLTSTSKGILDELLAILNTYPELTLEITSHTDSRGSTEYNQSLSEKRLESTLDYLSENGIDSNRITGEAFGESKLLNNCDDSTKCTEAMHKQNRRSEINVIEF
ncbi:OmpA family protein [Formosa algae]|uniref:Outer membrane protein OmpA-like peptidoglycan-associated protein n=1 Tax=Formosa algae TaxID=225843 RepID=A0A9X0YP62_9FLAO|nr:OmpA family protein [Formosa algae]MBP1841064.1 outer membrane protein OmpA-like peptidoglycan-associated protein [Formosa algae]MDQ0336516.1 outer membrane protein OmpA-like peptidoglycan-associated protein [Formosa algae]OEI81474.1 hypothetical protein AST99_04350 [Formosa algae]PNW25822.1 hypothetical protein BKP44_18965 [Formosa algae]